MQIFELIKEYFTQLSCEYCKTNFEPDNIRLLDERNDYIIVGLLCSNCKKGITIAILSINKIYKAKKVSEFTEEEKIKFSKLPPISSDEVIAFHNLLEKNEEEFLKYLNNKII